MKPDVYLKKEIPFHYAGASLRFRVSQDLFSSYEVDAGTQRLLRSFLDVETAPFTRILDLGCGYGPLGLTWKKLDPQRTVHMVDRDALAVHYARQNAALNELPDVAVYGSLGYDDVTAAELDLILVNVPAKAGAPVIACLLRDAAHLLRPAGLVAVVVVTALESLAAEILAEPSIQVHRRKSWPGHTVFHYSFAQVPARPAGSALERGVYDRPEVTVVDHGLSFCLRPVYGLPAFDAPDHATGLLLEGLAGLSGEVRRAVVLNPGQGYVPVALWLRFRPEEIVLVDRDLLGLRCAWRNLVSNGCPGERAVLRHQVGLDEPGAAPADLVAGVLREEEGAEAIAATIAQAAAQLAAGGTVLLAASSTAVTRVVQLVQSNRWLGVRRRTRRRGDSLLVLQQRARQR